MNELLDIANKLYDEYGRGKHWEIMEANRIGYDANKTSGWTIVIKQAEEKNGGAANESNE